VRTGEEYSDNGSMPNSQILAMPDWVLQTDLVGAVVVRWRVAHGVHAEVALCVCVVGSWRLWRLTSWGQSGGCIARVPNEQIPRGHRRGGLQAYIHNATCNIEVKI